MKRFASLALVAGMIVVGLGGFTPRGAHAAVNVGDQPKMAFKSADGSPVSLEQYKGKIIVVDFWATWCGPCMAQAEHMVQINQKYGPVGLQMIGISLDRDPAAMVRVAKEKGFNWPQFVDGTDGTRFSPEWGVTGIPATFILAPDGKVLWSGHPAAIDPQLEKAFKENPPVLVDPKVLAESKAAVATAESALAAGDAKAALAAMAKVASAAKADKEFAAKADAVRKTLEAEAEKLLAAVEPTIQAGQWAEATARLKELGDGLGDLPTGAKAKRRLAELTAKPEVKTALAKAERQKLGQAALDVAQKLKDDKKPEQAYLRFKAVATDFTDTDAGPKTAEAVKEFEKDPNFVKRVNESAASAKATSTLKLAQSYASAGRTDMARKKYQEVIAAYPGTRFAETAKKEMAALPK